jgi:osmotically-inducible protein OsmY
VKSALSASESSDATRIKVVTENGVVYLMGLLTRAEADAAVDIARDIHGVQKIVKVFEYIN